MDHGAYRSFIDSQSEGQRAYQHGHLIGHPALLVAPPQVALHLSMISNRANSLLFQESYGLLDFVNGGRINNHVAAGILIEGRYQEIGLRASSTLFHNVAQIRPMEAGDVLMRIAQPELIDNIVTHPARGAGRKCSNG